MGQFLPGLEEWIGSSDGAAALAFPYRRKAREVLGGDLFLELVDPDEG